ncbi:transcriptional regulator, TetR family [Desulfocicer vacuolatum DSM 3385]|uniref:Transcriptional regulator, TetR family n=1 Tax=Desulfocicer vacuolatum DSM 3385 TaxID=1121400 RepID=A0A1W2BYM3_9BACT|nr:TetR/AcrR family transcriptional regulator [Desulfocicer vacuolatum]SMC78053.1 transcriptional regulator, TetR family [Desulfocicer vacuolatum DSM 3385]
MGTYASSKQTRELLINAAGELVAQLGFSNVSTRAVADKAEQNIGSIHYHFKSKDNLFQAMIKSATQPVRNNPLAGIIKAHEKDLDSPEGQSRMLRRIIHSKIKEIFNSQRPWWHNKVIYQVLRAEENLLKIMRDEVIKPELAALEKLFLSIDPTMDKDDAFVQTVLTMSPIIYHAENAENILKFMGKKIYADHYLQKLEDKIVRQNQLLLGLPPDGQ